MDAVENDRYVFNIKGNHYRLVALIHFRVRTVYVLFVGKHQQYDKIDASVIEYKQENETVIRKTISVCHVVDSGTDEQRGG